MIVVEQQFKNLQKETKNIVLKIQTGNSSLHDHLINNIRYVLNIYRTN